MLGDYRCNNCEWEGDELSNTSEGFGICPECESGNWEPSDTVDQSNYRDQNPIDYPTYGKP